MSAPAWALSLAYWLHMLATIVWIGGLASMSILVIPAARRALDTRQYAMLLGALQARLEPLGWFSIILLVGTGMLQMSASPNYQGFPGNSKPLGGCYSVETYIILLNAGHFSLPDLGLVS